MTRSHARPPRRSSPGRPARRAAGLWRTLTAGLVVGVVALAGAIVEAPAAMAAPGDPFDPSVPRVLIGQNLPTQLFGAVQTPGEFTFVDEGPVTAVGYNAMGYNVLDDYIYALRRDNGDRELIRIGQEGAVTPLGDVTGLPDIPGVNYYNQGTFGAGPTAGILFVRGSTTNNQMYGIDVAAQTATLITLSQPVPNLSDIVFMNGYVWGVFSDDTIYRMDPVSGQVMSWVTGLGLNFAFGAQWVFGNGNLGVLANGPGTVYQVAIANPASASPTFTLVSAVPGLSSANNDGASVPGLDVDLGIVKTGPETYEVGDAITYSLVVTNHGPGVSSGSIVTDPLPAGITGASTSTPGCSIAAGTLTCALTGLAIGASTSIFVSGTVAVSTVGPLTNTATVTGYEHDPFLDNNRSTTRATPPPFSCAADAVYGLNTTGEILAIAAGSGASVPAGYFPSGATLSMNSLALTSDGRYAYAVTSAGVNKTVYRYDSQTAVAEAVGTIPGTDSFDLFMGAYNPANGLYYVGGVSGGEYVFFAFDTGSNTSAGQQFRLTPPAGAGFDGDLAFDSTGRAFVVMSTGTGASGNQLVVVEDVPTDGSLAAARVLANPAPTTAVFQGAAFGVDGYLYLQYASGATRMLTQTDPNSGAAVAARPILNPVGTANTLVSDLASCAYPSTLTLQKDIDGRYADGDQFAVRITGHGIAQGNTGATSGSSTGLQTDPAATAGPVLALAGRTYELTELAIGGAVDANYRSSWWCIDTNDDELIAEGDGREGFVTMPSIPSGGMHVLCVFSNRAIPTWEIGKEALLDGEVLAPGATVRPGDTLTYRVTATNTSAADLAGATLADDLSDVLDDAVFVSGSAELVIGAAPPVSVDDPVDDELSTASFVLPAHGTAVLTYQVVVAGDAWSTTLTNVVTGAAGPKDDLIDPTCPDTCTTTQITPTPLQVQKVGEDHGGDVVAMDGSQWAIYATATGGTAIVEPISPAMDGTDPVTGLFRDTSLTAGIYWLEETRALAGFQLLAERVEFAIAADGTISLGAGAASSVSLVEVDGVSTIRVEDVPTFDLPEAGGTGSTPIHLAGGLLVAVALAAAAAIRIRRRPLRGHEAQR